MGEDEGEDPYSARDSARDSRFCLLSRNLRVTAKPAAAIIAIALIIAVLTLHRLGAGDVCTGNEAVEGVFVQQMVEHGHLLFPVENGNVPMYKPPLFHWTAVAIDRVLDIRKVTAANLRLPSALYAIAGAVLTMLLAYEILGLDAAVLAGLDSRRVLPVHQPGPLRPRRHDAMLLRVARVVRFSVVDTA